MGRAATVKEYLTVQQEGNPQVSRNVEPYNLEVIISVGDRVKSPRGTQFRIGATHGDTAAEIIMDRSIR